MTYRICSVEYIALKVGIEILYNCLLRHITFVTNGNTSVGKT